MADTSSPQTKHIILTLVGSLGLMALITGFGLYMSGFFGGWATQLEETFDAVHTRSVAFLVALDEDRYADALALMDAEYRSRVPLEKFRDIVENDPFLSTIRSGELGHMKTYNADTTAVLSGSLTTAPATLHAEIHLTLEGDQWHVHEVVLGGRPTLAPAARP